MGPRGSWYRQGRGPPLGSRASPSWRLCGQGQQGCGEAGRLVTGGSCARAGSSSDLDFYCDDVSLVRALMKTRLPDSGEATQA